MKDQLQYSLPLEALAERRGSMPEADQELIGRAIRCLEERYLVKRDLVNSPDLARDFARLHLTGLTYEVFAVLWLDARMRLIRYEELFRGTIDGASVHPREVVRKAIRHGACACIFAHNHPSGNPQPSAADIRLTRRLQDALSLIDVSVKDHLVVGDNGAASLAESGHL